jgi:RHS repeat-associated protein
LNQQRYKPFGEVRTDLPSPAYRITITDFGYTGQKSLMGLLDYHARWYDQGLARLISADTIVPNPGNSMSWDRFAYVNGNPLSLIDPTGHFGMHREDRSDYWNRRNQEMVKQLEAKWERERAEKSLKQLVQQASKEILLDSSLGLSWAGGGKVLINDLFYPPEPPSRSIAQRLVEGVVGSFLLIAGLGVSATGGILILGGVAETTTVVGGVLATHQGPIGVGVGVIGLGIMYLGGNFIYDAITRP